MFPVRRAERKQTVPSSNDPFQGDTIHPSAKEQMPVEMVQFVSELVLLSAFVWFECAPIPGHAESSSATDWRLDFSERAAMRPRPVRDVGTAGRSRRTRFGTRDCIEETRAAYTLRSMLAPRMPI